ncbi:hypothetical protein UY3_11720 [Chelonia mydas]|uniref:Uncharacterized protein n=1 Tax=Chelonia mydas TaxID=8469 RepID=M7BGD5_CHEMY|nr:hypothetical protein UY3_11720 [Chelonia mydas]
MDALIVGALGTWDLCNERVLQTCGIGRCYARLMRRLMVSHTIRWSRDIYIEHITGHRQYQKMLFENNAPLACTLAKPDSLYAKEQMDTNLTSGIITFKNR